MVIAQFLKPMLYSSIDTAAVCGAEVSFSSHFHLYILFTH